MNAARVRETRGTSKPDPRAGARGNVRAIRPAWNGACGSSWRTKSRATCWGWGREANHLAKDFFRGLEGDVRVPEDTIIVTYYNAPKEAQLHAHCENLPHQLRQESINPQVPWLYGFQPDFRFR